MLVSLKLNLNMYDIIIMFKQNMSKVFKLSVISSIAFMVITGVLVYFFRNIYKKISKLDSSLKKIDNILADFGKMIVNNKNLPESSIDRSPKNKLNNLNDNNYTVSNVKEEVAYDNSNMMNTTSVPEQPLVHEVSNHNIVNNNLNPPTGTPPEQNDIENIKYEINSLKKDISDIEELMTDSQSELSNSEVKNVIIDSQSNNLINSEDQVRNKNDSEFENLDVIEIDNNSEFNELRETINFDNREKFFKKKNQHTENIENNFNINSFNLSSDNLSNLMESFGMPSLINELNHSIDLDETHDNEVIIEVTENKQVSSESETIEDKIDLENNLLDNSSNNSGNHTSDENREFLKEILEEKVLQKIDIRSENENNLPSEKDIDSEFRNIEEVKLEYDNSSVKKDLLTNVSEQEILDNVEDENDKNSGNDNLNTSQIMSDLSSEIVNNYTKKQLEKLCLEMKLNKNGNKRDLVNRLNSAGFDFSENIQSLS